MIEKFDFTDWDSQWAGNWPILAFSYWGPFYSQEGFSEYINRYVHHTIIIRREDNSAAYQRKSEKAVFAKRLIKKLEKNENLLIEVCEKLKQKTDLVLELMEKWTGRDIVFKEYLTFQKALLSYYPYHIKTKVLVDYLPPDLLTKFLPLLREARIYAEPVFSKAIELVKELSKIHAKKTGYTTEMISAMVKEEFEDYLQNGNLPAKEILMKRSKASAFLFFEGKMNMISDIEAIEKIVTKDKFNGVLQGQAAHRGFAKGMVKIINDPNLLKSFYEGNILVAGMTRPEYVPLMEKAAAIITDGGGILCHAAIVAREMNKPCIIGTQIATKVLKDGDLVEIDAEKGVIKKI